MDEQLRIGVLATHGVETLRADPRVDVALAHPDVQLAPGDALEVGAEEHVRAEQDLAIRGDGPDHGLGVRRRAAVVGERLHLGGGVDV